MHCWEKPSGRWGTSRFSFRKKSFSLLFSRPPPPGSAVWGSEGYSGGGKTYLWSDGFFRSGLLSRKNFPPLGMQCFSWQRLHEQELYEDPEFAWHALDTLAQIQQSSFIQVNTYAHAVHYTFAQNFIWVSLLNMESLKHIFKGWVGP